MRIEANRVNTPPVAGDVAQSKPTPDANGQAAEQAESTVLKVPGSGQNAAAQYPELEQVVEKMNNAVQSFSHTLKFEVSKSHRIIVRVIDTNTGEIIRQIPPEELMDTFKRMEDALGVLIDRRV